MFVDSSDWVMVPNVYGMGLFSDGGIFATKPYICGSSYFMKMMDFKKGDWCNTMDGLYWRFIDRNRKFFSKNPRLSMMVHIFDKMKKDRKKLILSEADKFIKQNTIKWKKKIFPLKSALFVKDLFFGVENGDWIGKKLSIVQRDALAKKYDLKKNNNFIFSINPK